MAVLSVAPASLRSGGASTPAVGTHGLYDHATPQPRALCFVRAARNVPPSSSADAELRPPSSNTRSFTRYPSRDIRRPDCDPQTARSRAALANSSAIRTAAASPPGSVMRGRRRPARLPDPGQDGGGPRGSEPPGERCDGAGQPAGDGADRPVPGPPGVVIVVQRHHTRALASDAIRGGLERHFGVRLAFQNCHRVAAFRPAAVHGPAYRRFVSARAQLLNQRPELRNC
jgi:hypothetical protein